MQSEPISKLGVLLVGFQRDTENDWLLIFERHYGSFQLRHVSSGFAICSAHRRTLAEAIEEAERRISAWRGRGETWRRLSADELSGVPRGDWEPPPHTGWLHLLETELRSMLSGILPRTTEGEVPSVLLDNRDVAAAWDDGWSYGWLAVEWTEDPSRVRIVYNALHDPLRHCTDLKAELPAYDRLPAVERAQRNRIADVPAGKVGMDVLLMCEALSGADLCEERDGALSFTVPLPIEARPLCSPRPNSQR